MLRPPTIAIERPMGAERWQDQNSVQIAGAISFERALFVTNEGFFRAASEALGPMHAVIPVPNVPQRPASAAAEASRRAGD